MRLPPVTSGLAPGAAWYVMGASALPESSAVKLTAALKK
jgi:hypothetical protein